MSVFKVGSKPSKERNMFYDERVDIARYDDVKYPKFEQLTNRQLGFFWRPEEIDLTRDSKEFKELSEPCKHIFTSNLKRQILLDSIQGRAPNLAFLPIVSLPEAETFIETWTFSETIHSRSYTHIIRNIFSDPSEVFDNITSIEEIALCAKDVSYYYDEVIKNNSNPNRKTLYEQKKDLWLCLNAVNALEGIRFYVSFACSWAFAEALKVMEGNAKTVKLIARDENVHLSFTVNTLKYLPLEDPDFAKIKVETADEVLLIMEAVTYQEMDWADYLFAHGSMIGLSAELLKNYVEWIAAKRSSALGIKHQFKGGSNPLPWTQRWIGGRDVQEAPQETEKTSYITGGVTRDMTAGMFKGVKL